MMDAQRIAQLIDVVATLTVRGAIDLPDASDLNRALWDLARANGCGEEVDSLVQAMALAEMRSALPPQ
jgi:hypothetical protein